MHCPSATCFPENEDERNSSLDVGPYWVLRKGAGPLIGIALHAGHNLRSELVPLIEISEEQRFREEDPYSDYWASVCGTQIITLRSRFEVDLNRCRSEAIYRNAEDSWGLKVWNDPPGPTIIKSSLAEHDYFYSMLKRELAMFEKQFGRFVVLDFHSYNQRREGALAPISDPQLNPEINIGTGSMDRERWEPIVDGFIQSLRSAEFLGRSLDVRENVNFKGRFLCQFVHHHFPQSGCAIAIEVRKFFMDEWTGLADTRQIAALKEVFRRGASEITNLLESM